MPPYKPQTNGKLERFWRTSQEDFIHETDFDSLDELKEELNQYYTTTTMNARSKVSMVKNL